MITGEQIDVGTPTFDQATAIISTLVTPYTYGVSDGVREYEIPGWQGSIARLDLDDTVAMQTGLSNPVRAKVFGDRESGIAIVFRSRNLFKPGRYAFYLKPTDEGGLNTWQAPASSTKGSGVFSPEEYLDQELAVPSTIDTLNSLLVSLQHATQ